MRNANKVGLNAVRILQVTTLKFWFWEFGSDRVDEEAQKKQSVPLRNRRKAHGHLPSAWIHLNCGSSARIQPTPGTRAPRCRETVQNHAFLLFYGSNPFTLTHEHSGMKWSGCGSRRRTVMRPRRGATLKSACAPQWPHRPVGTPQFMRDPRRTRARGECGTTGTSGGQTMNFTINKTTI